MGKFRSEKHGTATAAAEGAAAAGRPPNVCSSCRGGGLFKRLLMVQPAGGFPAADSVQDVGTAAFQYYQPLQALSEPGVNMAQLPGHLPPPALDPHHPHLHLSHAIRPRDGPKAAQMLRSRQNFSRRSAPCHVHCLQQHTFSANKVVCHHHTLRRRGRHSYRVLSCAQAGSRCQVMLSEAG